MPAPVGRDAADKLLPQYYSKPGQLRQEYGIDSILQLSTQPGEEISRMVPEFPQQRFPDKYGYRSLPLTIYDVLATDRWAPVRRAWTSGASSLGNPRVDEIQFGHGGEQRNSLTGLNNSA
jgi:hypothetical protein